MSAEPIGPPQAGTSTPNKGKPAPERRPRSPRHVLAAAKLLQKEARQILQRHRGRIAAEPVQAIEASLANIDRLRDQGEIAGLEVEVERLDELLHQHAAFARKSALRETLENIGIAVLIALGLRACFYEPFKIPSGSMTPTLLTGDHIFVNKFIYGIQIPFTTTVVGESLGEIERGDVVVFRYPLDQSEDYIKRVIGLPGDEVRVTGRNVAIKRAGSEAFEELPRERLDDPCRDEDGLKVVPGCQLYRETLDDKTYVVRYVTDIRERNNLVAPTAVWKVPEGHLMVMGDNRNASHDSRLWELTVEAVTADGLLSHKDLRDLVEQERFDTIRPETWDAMSDPHHDHVIHLGKQRSRGHDLSLAIWREPVLGADAVFTALRAQLEGATDIELGELAAELPEAERQRATELGSRIDTLAVGDSEDGRRVLALLREPQAVVDLQCGERVCKRDGELGSRLVDVLTRFEKNRDAATRDLLEQPDQVHYSTNWSGRNDPRDHYGELRFAASSAKRNGLGSGPRHEVRLRVFRRPDAGVDLVRDAALASFGPDAKDAKTVDALGEDARRIDLADRTAIVLADRRRGMAFVLECGRAVCPEPLDVAQRVVKRISKAALDRRELPNLLVAADLPGLQPVTVAQPERAEFDRFRLEATVKAEDHGVEVQAWLRPEAGLDAHLQSLAAAEPELRPDASITEHGLYAELDRAFVFAFAVPQTEVAVRIVCRKGLCPEREDAAALARRAAENALDTAKFVNPAAKRPRPFVPRGHVKGRAERIWLPLSRFWLPIR